MVATALRAYLATARRRDEKAHDQRNRWCPVETHNWGKSVAFWKGLGYELELETDHHSGRLRHPAGGPYLFWPSAPTNILFRSFSGCASSARRSNRRRVAR